MNVGIQDNGKRVLSYTSLGRPYIIPQVHIDQGGASVLLPDKPGKTDGHAEQLIDALSRFSGKFVFLPCDDLKKEDMIIGYFENKFYISSGEKRPEEEHIRKYIQVFLKNYSKGKAFTGKNYVNQNHSIIESPETARVYAKVAMNTLALVMGKNYASHPNFDDMKRWILTGESEQNDFFLPSILTSEINNFTRIFPENAHWCLLYGVDHNLEAMVCFYNRYMHQFILGELVKESDFKYPMGFICDWKESREYTLEEFCRKIN